MHRQGSPTSSRKRRVALAGALLLTGLLPSAASAACASTSLSTPFSRFGDSRQYSLVPGGAFETGTSGWALGGASVESGNETYKVHGSSDAKSLKVDPTDVTVSAPICIGVEHPSFRFLAKRSSGSWGTLLVKLRWSDSGGSHDTVVGSLDGNSFTSWQPSQSLQLATTLPIQPGQTMSVRVVFDPEDYGGAWAVDDLFYDPYKKS